MWEHFAKQRSAVEWRLLTTIQV